MTGEGKRGFVLQPLDYNDYKLPITSKNDASVIQKKEPKPVNS